jgi:hypothetical protein
MEGTVEVVEVLRDEITLLARRPTNAMQMGFGLTAGRGAIF